MYFASRDHNHIPQVAALHPSLLSNPDLTAKQYAALVDSLVQVRNRLRTEAFVCLRCSLCVCPLFVTPLETKNLIFGRVCVCVCEKKREECACML
jgi:hypothetical protein